MVDAKPTTTPTDDPNRTITAPPWKIRDRVIGGVRLLEVEGSNLRGIAQIYTSAHHPEEATKNALVIVNAPRLLEAAEKLIASLGTAVECEELNALTLAIWDARGLGADPAAKVIR